MNNVISRCGLKGTYTAPITNPKSIPKTIPKTIPETVPESKQKVNSEAVTDSSDHFYDLTPINEYKGTYYDTLYYDLLGSQLVRRLDCGKYKPYPWKKQTYHAKNKADQKVDYTYEYAVVLDADGHPHKFSKEAVLKMFKSH
jgi:hypothetical protein